MLRFCAPVLAFTAGASSARAESLYERALGSFAAAERLTVQTMPGSSLQAMRCVASDLPMELRNYAMWGFDRMPDHVLGPFGRLSLNWAQLPEQEFLSFDLRDEETSNDLTDPYAQVRVRYLRQDPAPAKPALIFTYEPQAGDVDYVCWTLPL
jgi:hypothetical protein